MADTTPKPLSTKPLSQVGNVRELLVNDVAKRRLAAVAASTLNPDRMLKLLTNALRTTPQLGDCDPMSLLGALMTCSSLGLEPNTVLGHAYLVPFKNRKKNITEVQLIIGYKGLIDLARRSGHVVSIHADVVYEGDEFSYHYGSGQHLRHVPKGRRGAGRTPIHAYAYASLTDGEAFIVWDYADILALRDSTQAYQQALRSKKEGKTWLFEKAPWVAHEHQMAAKTMIRRLANELPLSIEFMNAIAADEHKIDYAAFARTENPSDVPTDIVDGIDYSTDPGDDDMIDEDDAPAKDEPKERAPEAKKPTDKPKDPPGGQQDDASGGDADAVAEEIINALADVDDAAGAQNAMRIYADEYRALPAEQTMRVLDAARAKGFEG